MSYRAKGALLSKQQAQKQIKHAIITEHNTKSFEAYHIFEDNLITGISRITQNVHIHTCRPKYGKPHLTNGWLTSLHCGGAPILNYLCYSLSTLPIKPTAITIATRLAITDVKTYFAVPLCSAGSDVAGCDGSMAVPCMPLCCSTFCSCCCCCLLACSSTRSGNSFLRTQCSE